MDQTIEIPKRFTYEYINNIRKYVNSASYKDGFAYFLLYTYYDVDGRPVCEYISLPTFWICGDMIMGEILPEDPSDIPYGLAYDVIRTYTFNDVINHSNICGLNNMSPLNININDNGANFCLVGTDKIMIPQFKIPHYLHICNKTSDLNPMDIFTSSDSVPLLLSSLDYIKIVAKDMLELHSRFDLQLYSVKFDNNKWQETLNNEQENLDITKYLILNYRETIKKYA